MQELAETDQRISEYNNVKKKSNMNSSMDTDNQEKRQQPKKHREFQKGAISDFFNTLCVERQDEFLNSIESKVNEYKAEKYRRFLEYSDRHSRVESQVLN